MTYAITQTADGRWQVTRAGAAVGETHDTYDQALGVIALALNAEAIEAAQLAVDSEAGLLPEEWVSPIMCETGATGPGRDFTNVTWEARDPANNLVPLMLSTTTDIGGHIGAELAGYFTSIDLGPTPAGRGRFYDTDVGRRFRDMLLGGRRFGVSVDPTENVEYQFVCTEFDEDGWCQAERIEFSRYEIGGMTGVPFPGFENAYIVLAGAEGATAPAEEPEDTDAAEDEAEEGLPPGESDEDEAAASVTASGDDGACCDSCRDRTLSAGRAAASLVAAGGAVRPPSDWFANPQLDRLTPLTITDDGEVYGHLAPWAQCHTGSRPGDCVMTPRSLASYAYFRTGYVVADDGAEIPTGRLTLGGGHADLRLSYRGASEHYDNAGSAIADLAAGEDAFGVWVHGSLRPGVSEETIRAARASSPSGDWRPVGGGLELVAALCVNQPGFPIARVASGRIQALVAAGAAVMAQVAEHPEDDRYKRLESQVEFLTRMAAAPARAHLSSLARDRLRERLRG